MCRVYMNGNDKGTLTVSYGGTPIIWISMFTSLLTLIVAARSCFMRNRKRKPDKNDVGFTKENEGTEGERPYFINSRGGAASGKEGHE